MIEYEYDVRRLDSVKHNLSRQLYNLTWIKLEDHDIDQMTDDVPAMREEGL